VYAELHERSRLTSLSAQRAPCDSPRQIGWLGAFVKTQPLIFRLPSGC
jgi:hypothetical protein